MRYDLHEEIEMRLTGTVILYNREPYLVRQTVVKNPLYPQIKTFGVLLEPLPRGSVNAPLWPIVDQGDAGLSTKLSLGFINHKNAAFYVGRSPVRKYRAGVYRENVSIWSSQGASMPNNLWDTFTSVNDFSAMVAGRYPTVQECIDSDWTIRNGVLNQSSKAFHRHLALIKDELRGDYLLVYKTQTIGFGDGRSGFKLVEGFEHLDDGLREKGVTCRT